MALVISEQFLLTLLEIIWILDIIDFDIINDFFSLLYDNCDWVGNYETFGLLFLIYLTRVIQQLLS